MDLLISETISKEDYQRRIKELDVELTDYNKKIEDLVVEQKTDELMKKKYKDLQKTIKDNMNTEKTFPELFRLLVDRVVVNKIDGDRHNVKLDIYVNVLNEKISVCNQTFLKDNLHPLCSHEENNYTCSITRRKYY